MEDLAYNEENVKGEGTEITLVIEDDLMNDLKIEFGAGSGVVIDQIKSDFRRIISKAYLG